MVPLTGTTAGSSALTPTACNDGSGPEVVYAVTPAEAGTLAVTLSSDKAKVLYVRQDACAGTDLSCMTGKPATAELIVEAGKTYYVVVDGAKAGDAGAFSLVLTLSQCGNGTIDADEECDDANLVPGDTCDNQCKVVCSGGGTTKRPAPYNTCYRYVDSDKKWDDAQAACVGWGGNLVSIGDLDEQKFVKPLNNNKGVWIGAKRGSDSTLYWVDGTPPWTPGNWASGEPNNSWEQCVQMYANGQWNDSVCWPTYPFICERAPVGQKP
jgi:cysteine-rich repeat protein